MARLVNPNDILEVIIHGRHSDQVTMSVFHYIVTGIPVGSDGSALAVNMTAVLNGAANLVSKYANCCGSDFVLENLSAQWVFTTRYTRQDFVPALGNGTGVDICLPPNDGIAITKRTDVANKHNRGTLHMPGTPRDFVDQGKLTVVGKLTYLSLASQVAAVVNVVGGAVFTPVIFNRVNPALSPTILSTTVQDTVRVNRRRTVGLGI